MQQLEALAPRGHSGIGFWRDGAEESRLIHTSPGTIQKAMAALGLKFNQKAVIGFTSHEDGSDTAHVLVVPRGYSPEKIHKDLMEHGIEYKTIIPGSEGKYTVHILDNGSALGDSVKSYAQKVGARHWSTPGSVVFIGGDTREDAKQQYQHVLRGS